VNVEGPGDSADRLPVADEFPGQLLLVRAHFLWPPEGNAARLGGDPAVVCKAGNDVRSNSSMPATIEAVEAGPRRSPAQIRRRLPRLSAPFVNKAGANIGTGHLRNHRAGLVNRRQYPSAIFAGPTPTPLVIRYQCHPTHAVQLASLMNPT
jgi:hypothetical protein